MEIILKRYDALTLDELYDILRLRCEVFILEQLPYQDIDRKDQFGWHMLAKEGEDVVATLRIVEKGIIYPSVTIGRFCVAKSHRGKGLARKMLGKAIDFITSELGEKQIEIGAQVYLTAFYESAGFVPVGEVFADDGIPHIHMIRREAD